MPESGWGSRSRAARAGLGVRRCPEIPAVREHVSRIECPEITCNQRAQVLRRAAGQTAVEVSVESTTYPNRTGPGETIDGQHCH